jgi:hypothetical protein
MIIRCRLCTSVSKNGLAVEAGDWCVLVVFENPCIHCPAEQTTIELVVTGAARATKREVKMTSKVDSIAESSKGREFDRNKDERDEGER